jgi:hypothetical protein
MSRRFPTAVYHHLKPFFCFLHGPTVSVIPSTLFIKSGAHVSLKDLRVGDCMVVEAKENKDDKRMLLASRLASRSPTLEWVTCPVLICPSNQTDMRRR